MVRGRDKGVPQGLKPAFLSGFFGTTEFVLLKNRILCNQF